VPIVKRGTTAGTSLLELVVVVAVATIMTGMAVPVTVNAMRSYRLTAAVSAATGAIQSTRYAAIMHGYPYQITFTPATDSYQIYDEPGGQSTYSAVGTPIPISRPGDVTISQSVTYQFSPGGTVTPSNMSFSITNDFGGSSTITVSGVGNVSVSTP